MTQSFVATCLSCQKALIQVEITHYALMWSEILTNKSHRFPFVILSLKDANKVQQKTSRRKKTTSLKETEEVSSDKEKNSSEKDSKKKDGRKDKFDRSQKRSGNASSSNRRDKNRSQKSEHESATNGPQDVQPLMEIQTGNWHDAESRMSNHIDSMPFESNQGTSGSRGRYQRRGKSFLKN